MYTLCIYTCIITYIYICIYGTCTTNLRSSPSPPRWRQRHLPIQGLPFPSQGVPKAEVLREVSPEMSWVQSVSRFSDSAWSKNCSRHRFLDSVTGDIGHFPDEMLSTFDFTGEPISRLFDSVSSVTRSSSPSHASFQGHPKSVQCNSGNFFKNLHNLRFKMSNKCTWFFTTVAVEVTSKRRRHAEAHLMILDDNPNIAAIVFCPRTFRIGIWQSLGTNNNA